MVVTCAQCGYENNPQHQFCGMCGEPLRAPYAAPPPPSRPVPGIGSVPEFKPAPESKAMPESRPVPGISGPSILGIGNPEPSSRDVEYLLEDDEPRGGSRALVYLLLLVMVGAASVAAWRWREGGYPWEARWSLHPAPAVTPAAVAPPAQPGVSPASPVTAANPPAATTPDASAPANQAAAPTSTATPQPAAANDAHPATVQPGGDSTAPPPEQAPDQPKPSEPKAAAPVAQSKAVPLAKPQALRKAQAQSTDNDNSSDDADDDNQTAEATPPRKVSKPSPKDVALATPSDPTEAWVSDGQKYLYGNGVPQNCARAKAQMLAAAARSNAEAESTLGTMYATGHCVNRDVISAYRWFAQALHNDRTNARIEQDLRVLWNQMTPEEKQAAIQRDNR
jgi:hypothetical protein